MTTTRKDLEKRLIQLKLEVLTRGFERYPTVLKNISDLPTELQSPAMTTLATSEVLQTIIAFPPQIHRGWHYVPKQALLFTSTDVIHLLASIWPGQEPQITYLKGRGLMYMKVTLILLYGFLEIVAQGHNSLTRLSIEFNTVTWDRIFPPLRQLLQATITLPSGPSEETTYIPSVQKSFEKLPLKFSNGVKIFGLLSGEELKALVFQPGTWKRWLFLIRQPISRNLLLILTSNYMVVIQEDPDVGQGWIISYLPRNSIAGIKNQPRSLWNELTVQLKREDQTVDYKLLLKGETAQAWRERWLQHNSQWQDVPDTVEK
jgi:hypothetical protein